MMVNKYVVSQQHSKMWDLCLFSMAQELELYLDSKSLTILMHGTGVRMAKTMPAMQATVLPEVEDVLNQMWGQMNWGWVTLCESSSAIEITHSFSPLSVAFGAQSEDWLYALFEGFYSTVFHSLGASDELDVRQVGVSDHGQSIVFYLAQNR
ncbi:MAG: hypothetical protein R8K50_03275 [Mariprofundus sp.]